MMSRFSSGVPAHKAAWRAPTLLLLTVFASATVHAQATNDGAPSEAARRAAASPYRFILQNATAPARKPAPAAESTKREKAAEATAVQAAAHPAAPAPAPAPAAPAPVAVPAPALQPAEALAMRAPKPPEPPMRREIIPVRTDEPHLAAALLREKPNGVVRVQFDINPDGSTTAVKVVSSTNRVLNRPTIDAVNGWKFQPVDEVLTVETEVAYKYD